MKRLRHGFVDELLVRAQRASDMLPEQLLALAVAFEDAHERAPGGLSIEIGTRKGGSAWLMLSMLREMYDDAERPMLFTVDPYGGKPYAGGDRVDHGKLYDRNEYKSAKHWLAEFPEHAHFYMEAHGFFRMALDGGTYWLHGVVHGIDDFTFVLLDGDHSVSAIATEVYSAMPRMRKGGTILIDNVDKDPETIPVLREDFPDLVVFDAPDGARQARIIVP